MVVLLVRDDCALTHDIIKGGDAFGCVESSALLATVHHYLR